MNAGEFVEMIFTYESDTFSSSGSNIRIKEAQKIAAKLLDIFTMNHLDGVMISNLLDEIREDKENIVNDYENL